MLIPHLGVGGAQGAFLRLAKHLSKYAEVTIALMDRVEADNAPTELQTVSLSESRRSKGKLRRWWGMLRKLRAMKHEHDVAISFLSGANLLNALTGPRARTIVSERGSKRHDVGMTTLQRAIWTRILDPLIYWRAGRVVAASEGLAHEIISANRWAAKRVVAIEGTVKAAALVDAADLPVDPELVRLAEFETVVSFGRLHVSKGLDTLLHAFARVRASRPRARLLLVGAGPEEKRLKEIAEGLALRCGGPGEDADVIFAGVRSDPVRYCRLGRVFVLPSRFEGLPNALIEAIAAGVPVLASDCRWGPRSILSQGQLGYEDEEPTPPLRLAHGVLMPEPEARGAISAWVAELDHALSKPLIQTPRDKRMEAVARYDVDRTGPLWLRQVEELAASGGGGQ